MFITVVTDYQIGYMAVAIGFAIGMTIRLIGKGSTPIFGYVGASLSLVSCLLGNLLSICVVIANQELLPVMDIIRLLDVTLIVNIFKEIFDYIDLLFYGLAIYEGYKFSITPVAEQLSTAY